MELRLATMEQLETVYKRDLAASFPPAELRPLPVIKRLWEEGRYQPWCAFENGDVIGELFLWMGNPGWALGDYLCVARGQRNGGLGPEILKGVRRRRPELVILGETEDPADAPDPDMARRRVGFYRRNGARFAGFRSEVFGARYKLIYFAGKDFDDETLLREYDAIYRSDFRPEIYEKFVRIPWTEDMKPAPKVAWNQ